MKTILLSIAFIFIFGTSLYGENQSSVFEPFLKESPRLEYLQKNLRSRLSTHNLVSSLGERISNPLLIRDNILFGLDKLEFERVKFSLLKEISGITRALHSIRNRKQFTIDTEKEYLSRLEKIKENIDPEASLWVEEESRWWSREIDKLTEEENLNLKILKDKLKLKDNYTAERVIKEPGIIFAEINPGFETSLIERESELIKWKYSYFLELNNRYPSTENFISASSSVPYISFIFPLQKSEADEACQLALNKELLALKIARIADSYKKERLLLSFFYASRKKENIKQMLDRIKESMSLSSSFEDISTAKKIYLDTLNLSEDTELEIKSLREELLKYGQPTLNNEKFNFYTPALPEILNHAQNNSLLLKEKEEELRLIRKLTSIKDTTAHKYLTSLYEQRSMLLEEEKATLDKRITGRWYSLIIAKERLFNQKEKLELAQRNYELSLYSSSKTPFDKKLKEMGLLSHNLVLLDREKAFAISFLELKASLECVEPQEDLNFVIDENASLSLGDLKNKIRELAVNDNERKKRKKELQNNLIKEEIYLLDKKFGRIVFSDKKSLLLGNIESPFTLEVRQNIPGQITGEKLKSSLEGFLALKSKFSSGQKENIMYINGLLTGLTEKRLLLLEKRISEEKILLNKFLNNSYLEKEQLCINQGLRILNSKERFIDTAEIYLADLMGLIATEGASLNSYQEKLLLEKLIPLFTQERASLILLNKEEEVYLDSGNAELGLKYADNLNKGLLTAFKSLQDISQIFSVKNRVGLVSDEDLSQIKLLKDAFTQELFLSQRRLMALRKINLPTIGGAIFDLSIPSAGTEKYKGKLLEAAVNNSPSIRLVDLELKKFSSPYETGFIKYLQKEKKRELEQRLKRLFSNFEYLSRAAVISGNQKKTAKNEFLIGIAGLKNEKLWLYGAYGLDSILTKYLSTEKGSNSLIYKFKSTEFELSTLLNSENRTKEFNYQSILPPEAILKLKDVSSFLKERYLSFPALNKERTARRNSYRIQNYNRKIHAFNFYTEEKKRDILLKERAKLFERAREKEFQMSEYLDNLWKKENEERVRIRRAIEAEQIDLSKEVLSLIKILNLKVKDGLILELFFIRYAKRFGKEKVIKKYIEDIIALAEKEIINLDRLPSWWAKYTSPVLFYPEKSYLEEVFDLRILGICLYYSQLKEHLGKNFSDFISFQTKRDFEFLRMDLRNIPEEKIEPYLIWESGIRKELDQLTMSEWRKEALEEKRKIVLQYAGGLFGSLYGSLKDKVLQEEIVSWLISAGIEEKDYPGLFDIIERIRANIGEYYLPLSREEKLKLYEAVRLRRFLEKGENELFNDEENKFNEATLLGTILSLAGFFWENKINPNKGEDNLFFSFTDRLKKDEYFEYIFGNFSNISYPQKAFYLGSLNYWAKKWLEEYRKENNFSKAEGNIRKQLDRFKAIYSMDSFQKLYGPFNLNRVDLESVKEKKIAREFTGKVGFFSSWIENFSITEEEIGIFFNNLAILSSLKHALEKFYQNQGIRLKFDPDNPLYKEESLGILISWVQFFNYRGINGKDNFVNAISEMEFIQQKSLEYGLGLNIDEIRYWWEKMKLKDYTSTETEGLFRNISLVKKIISDSCQDLLKELNSIPLLEWENAELRKKIVEFINKKTSSNLNRQEIHYFAEKVMPLFDISFEELKKETKEKIYLEAVYSVSAGEPCSLKRLSTLLSIMNNRGYSIFEMGNLIYLASLIRKNPEINASNISDTELYGLLNYIFGQPISYDARVKSWINTASILEKYFYKEHGRFLDFSILSALINLPMTRYQEWQIKRYVEKGLLSSRSPDKEIRKTGEYYNFKRFILRTYWENSRDILSEDHISIFYDIYRKLNLKETEKTAIFKNLCEKICLFKTGTEILVTQLLYEKKISCKDIFIISNDISHSLVEEIMPYLINYAISGKDINIKNRVNLILEKQRLTPLISKKLNYIPFENKRSLENSLAEKAKSLYGIELPPHKLSALTWKVFEGLRIEDVLKIYTEDYARIEILYKNVFNKQLIDFNDSQLIQYFAEEINMGLLSENFLKDILSISAVVKAKLKKYFGMDISTQESLDYAWPVFYSGATEEVLEKILEQANLIRNKMANILPEEYSSDLLNNNIFYLLGQVYGIQLTDKVESPFPLDSYIEALKCGLKYLDIKEEEINKSTLKITANNLKISLMPPAAFLNTVKKTNLLHNFVKETTHKELSKRDILSYFDRVNKGSLGYFSLAQIYYPMLPSKISEIEVKILIDLAFKKFLDKSLNKTP